MHGALVSNGDRKIANTDEIMSDVMKVAGFVEGAYNSFCQAVSDEGAKTVEGRRLRYEVKGYFYRWELNYRAEVVDIATGVVGKAGNCVSKDRTIQRAIQDLFSQLGLPDPTEEGSGDTEEAGATAEAAPTPKQPERLQFEGTECQSPTVCQNSISFDDVPEMPQLLSFPISGGRDVNISEQIGTRYKPFGILLLQDRTGAVVDSIAHKNHYVPLNINLDILQQWSRGDKGMKPVSWRTLVDCLKKTGMTILAEDIEQELAG